MNFLDELEISSLDALNAYARDGLEPEANIRLHRARGPGAREQPGT